MKRLEVLDLSSNLMSIVHRDAFKYLRYLTSLNLEGNHMTSVPGFSTNANLKKINLNDNRWKCDCNLLVIPRSYTML